MQRRAQIVEEAEDLKGKIAEKDLQLAAASRPTEQDTPAAGAAVSAPPAQTPRIPSQRWVSGAPTFLELRGVVLTVRVPRAEKLVQKSQAKKAGEGDKDEYEAFLESF